jgi:molybdopterin-guanine dinucleotide biosynthesis protein A
VVLAGGLSKRFGYDKCLIHLAGKPLVLHTVDRISTVADKIAVVVGSKSQKERFSDLLKSKAEVFLDKQEVQSPVIGALTGFENIGADYSLLLPCDTPFVSRQIASLLLDLCVGKGAAIPRWSNGYIEPLQSAYHVKSGIQAAQKALDERKLNLSSMISNISGVRYISMLVLQQFDPKLLTFFNINTPADLKRAESILKTVYSQNASKTLF